MSNAFWVKLKFVDGLSVEQTNEALDKFFQVYWNRKCSADGGIDRYWSWVELIHVSDEIEDVTEKDRAAVIDYLSNDPLVTRYEVGELVSWESAEQEAVEVMKNSFIQHFNNQE